MNASPADRRPARPAPGHRWALLLAGALLVVVGASAAVRWTGAAADLEEIVQKPVPNTPPPVREEPTAPDPGDNP